MELINTVLAVLVKFIEHIITVMGPFGISLLMAIESCNIPVSYTHLTLPTIA